MLYGSQSRQLAITRKEKALAAELKERSAEIHEYEQKKIARDLHDGLSQNIALARMSVDRLPEGNVKKQLRISLDHSFQELRKLLFNLRSVEDFSGPPDDLVRQECEQFQERFGLEITVLGRTPFRPSWNMDHFAQFFRILYEGLINVIRHSGDGQTEVAHERGSGSVELFVRDRSRGYITKSSGFAGAAEYFHYRRMLDPVEREPGGQIAVRRVFTVSMPAPEYGPELFCSSVPITASPSPSRESPFPLSCSAGTLPAAASFSERRFRSPPALPRSLPPWAAWSSPLPRAGISDPLPLRI